MEKIDLVIPYVDNTDKVWQKIYLEYCNVYKLKANIVDLHTERYQDNLRLIDYQLKLINKNMPWVNKIYLLLMNREQAPQNLPSGRVCNSGVEIKEDYSHEKVFLNHYMTKSLSEFVKQKVNRGDAVFANRKIDFWYYWRINKKTKAKERYLQDMGLI